MANFKSASSHVSWQIAAQRAVDRTVSSDAVWGAAGGTIVGSGVAKMVGSVGNETQDRSNHLANFRELMLALRIRRATARPWESDLTRGAEECAALLARAAGELELARKALQAAEMELDASRGT